MFLVWGRQHSHPPAAEERVIFGIRLGGNIPKTVIPFQGFL